MAAWCKANGVKKTKYVLNKETELEVVECDTDDEKAVPEMHQSKDGGLDDKVLPRGGQDVLRAEGAHRHRGAWHVHGLRPEYDQRVHNGRRLNNANAIWLQLEGGRPRECAEDRRLVHSGAGSRRAERDAEGGGEHGEE